MKKCSRFGFVLEAILLLAVILAPLYAFSGQVYDRTVLTVGTSGAARWTNASAYSALELKRIWVLSNLFATNVVTATRVSADGLYTQAVGAVTCASGAGSTTSFTAGYLGYGDMLDFSSWLGTNGVFMIEYEVQQH